MNLTPAILDFFQLVYVYIFPYLYALLPILVGNYFPSKNQQVLLHQFDIG